MADSNCKTLCLRKVTFVIIYEDILYFVLELQSQNIGTSRGALGKSALKIISKIRLPWAAKIERGHLEHSVLFLLDLN